MDHLLDIATQQLVTIARTTAYHCDEQHDYMKGAGRTDWFPHKWVVEAMRAAVTIRNTQAEDKVREELHQARAERDALQQLLNARDEEIENLRAQLSERHHGDPVACVYMRNGEVNYDAEVVISNIKGDTLGDGDSWMPVFKEADAIKSEYFERVYELSMESHKKLSANLAHLDSLLRRALPFLSNTPDLVQHGAEDLANEIRSVSAGRPCYGPNEWGTECGQCRKCKVDGGNCCSDKENQA